MDGTLALKKIFISGLILATLGGVVYGQEELILKLKDADPVVRMKAAQELGNERVREAVPELIKALNDESSGVRINVIVSLGYLRDERAIEPLINILKKDENCGVRIMAVQTLGRFRDERIVKALGEMVTNEDSRVREAACRSLGKVGGPQEVDKLLYALKNDTNTLVRQSAINALTNLTQMGRDGEKRIDIEKVIKRVRRDKDRKVRNTAQEALQRLEKVPRKERNEK